MGLFLLTKDKILADFLLADCPALHGAFESASSLKKADLCVIDLDSIEPPYPVSACLALSRQKQETQIPLILRPLLPGALTEALSRGSDAFSAYLQKEKRALVSEKETIVFPPLEFTLLELLFENLGALVERDALCRALRSPNEGASHASDADKLLTVYIYRLRKKLSPLGFSLQSHHKNGYTLKKERND